MRRATTALLAVCLVSFAAFSAAAAPADPPPYPVQQFLDAFQNTERSLQNRNEGDYNFYAGIWGAERRVAQRYPQHYTDPNLDPRHEAQVTIDSLAHMRPKVPYAYAMDVGHPELYPDWDHDGVFGDPGGLGPEDEGDFDADTDAVLDSAYFLFPCYTSADEWEIHHRFSDGTCDVTDSAAKPYGIGVVHELKLINARGLVLDATLWLPTTAFAGAGCPVYGSPSYADDTAWSGCVSRSNMTADKRFPSVVFANGLASRQEHYAWFAMRMVDEGYAVLTYDPAGQGESEGTFGETIGIGDRDRACEFAGACRDLEDMVRWFVGRPITEVRDTEPRVEERANPATNAANPVLALLDLSRVAIAGNSMGAVSTLSYVDNLGRGAGIDGRPLPPVAAAISMSGATPTRAVVPIQFQTSDGDGSPLFVIPKVGGVNLGSEGNGIGYELIKQRYDMLRATKDPSPLSLIVLESGAHTDHVDVPFVPRTNWANSLAGDYAADWLNCHVQGIPAACATAVSARPHLSRVYASEQDPDGPDGSSPSRCIVVPDAASLNQRPDEFVTSSRGSPKYDCTP